MIDNFGVYHSNSENPRIPNMNFDKMVKYMDDNDIVKKCKLNAKQFMDEIMDLNSYYKNN